MEHVWYAFQYLIIGQSTRSNMVFRRLLLLSSTRNITEDIRLRQIVWKLSMRISAVPGALLNRGNPSSIRKPLLLVLVRHQVICDYIWPTEIKNNICHRLWLIINIGNIMFTFIFKILSNIKPWNIKKITPQIFITTGRLASAPLFASRLLSKCLTHRNSLQNLDCILLFLSVFDHLQMKTNLLCCIRCTTHIFYIFSLISLKLK